MEHFELIVEKAKQAIALIGKERLILSDECGFATFADSPVSDAVIAQAKLRNMAEAARVLFGF
ncbi:MAG: hypothetical protein K8F91_12430 [Candidatus Obscuribacterales bacterium]|nr:hypothetical protein [Candidatus Obscuribacterales bacterium]